MCDSFFDDITEKSSSTSQELMDNIVSRITISTNEPLYASRDNKTFIMFVDKNDNEQQRLLRDNDFKTLNTKFKIFSVNERHLNTLIKNIISTDSKFVYPLIFVNFIKSSFPTNKKIYFDSKELMKLRIWANQLRNEHGLHKKSNHYNTNELYLGYVICCEMLHYYMMRNDG